MNAYSDIITMTRPVSRRPGMSRADRAKLFAPFAALRGFEESAHAKERLYVPRPQPGPDRETQLDRRLRALRPGDRVTVTFFRRLVFDGPEELGELDNVTGEVERIDLTSRTLILSAARIAIRDILDVGAR